MFSFALARAEKHASGGRGLILQTATATYGAVDDAVAVLECAAGSPRWRRAAGVVRESPASAPSSMPDLIALRGDPSDGIPGAPGIGAKGAAALLARHGSLEAVLAAAGRGDASGRAARPGLLERAAADLQGDREAAAVRRRACRRRARGLGGRRRRPAELGMAGLAERRGAWLRRELDGDHVTVGHHVVAPLEPERSAVARAGVAAGVDQLVPADHLRANEPLLDVGVDLPCGMPRGEAAVADASAARAWPRRP